MNDPEPTKAVAIAEILQLAMHCTDLVSHGASDSRAGEPVSLVMAIRALRAKRGKDSGLSALASRAT